METSSKPFYFDTGVYSWPSVFFRKFGGTRRREIFVSLSFGVIEFLIGLLISSIGGLALLYLTTPGFYILAGCYSLFIDRGRWLNRHASTQFIPAARDVFSISTKEFYQYMSSLQKRVRGHSKIVFPLTILTFLLGVLGLGFLYFSPTETLLSGTETPYLSGWFSGDHIYIKFSVVAVYLFFVILFAVPSIIGTVFFLSAALSGFAMWPVVPIPSYVSIKVSRGASYLYRGTAVYAFVVLALVLFFQVTFNYVTIALVSVFVLAGIATILGALSITSIAVTKSREQLASLIGQEYFSEIDPFGSSEEGGIQERVDEVNAQRFDRLLAMQKVLGESSLNENIIEQIGTLIPSILLQGLP